MAVSTGANILKALVVVLVVGVLSAGAYTLGQGNRGATPSTIPTITPLPTFAPVVTPTPSISPSPTASVSSKQVSAGLKILVFQPYTITIPSGWTDVHTSDPKEKIDTLVVSNGEYSLTISQAVGGAGTCVYPGDASQPMAQTFTSFVDIAGVGRSYRRGTSDGATFTVCEKKTTAFVFPTGFG